MAIYDQSYQPWMGTYTSRARAIAAMVRGGLSQPFRSFWVQMVVMFTFAIVGGWILILFAIASSELPQVFVLGNNVYREEFYNNYMFSMILMVLSATVGASLISRDLSHNAHLMYFSRAITRGDYVLAKFLTLALFLLSVTWIPGVILFLGQMGIGTEKLTASQRMMDLGAITLHSLILAVPMSAAVLAASSLTSRAYLAGILWAAFFFSCSAFSRILSRVLNQDWCGLLSWTNLTGHLGNYVYQTRVVRSPFGYRAPPEILSCDWVPPLVILASITVLSLAVVRWRVRSVEGRE